MKNISNKIKNKIKSLFKSKDKIILSNKKNDIIINKYINIDLNFYRNHYEDISGFDDVQLLNHYQENGYHEGRICVYNSRREEFVETIKGEKILEIGPFDHPLLHGDNIFYADLADKNELIKKASECGSTFNQVPEIDYVIPDGSIKNIDQKFDAIISAHNIEHHPDLIAHLIEAFSILNEGGQYYLIIPNANYCFDASLPLTNVSEIIEASEQKRKVHSLNSIIKQFGMTSHNECIEYWRENNSKKLYPLDAGRIKRAIEVYRNSNGSYIDAHAWQFTPFSFSNIINCLIELEIIPFKKVLVNGPIYGLHEFTAILYK